MHTFEIVEVNNKKYAQFEDSKEIRSFLKKCIICAGGIIYKNNGKLVYAIDGAYGNLQEWYAKLFSKI